MGVPANRRGQYEAYIMSAAWQSRRAAVLSRAGHRCEHVTDDPRGMAVRCEAGGGLEVHHRTYDRLGGEADGDLQALCPLHHLTAHLMNRPCVRCGSPVFDDETDAMCHVRSFAHTAGLVGPPQLRDLLDISPSLCPYCRHMSENDD